MPSNFNDVANDALLLDVADRLHLAAKLIDSVEGRPDQDWEQAWLTELQSRREHGSADAIPWEEAKAQILRRLSKP